MTSAISQENNDFHSGHFDSIQALRGIAAVFVILEHIRFLNCGAFGVDIFFCISGFMIMFTTHSDTRNFLGKRLIRILPLYYIMTLGTYLLLVLFPGMFERTTANTGFLVKSMCFIPFDIGDGILQPLMRIGWTVNCEMFFYLLFFISFHFSHKYRGLICSGLLMLTVLLSHVLPVSFAPLTFYGNPVMLEFILGILCYYIARGLYGFHCRRQLPPFLMPLSVTGAAGMFILLLATKKNIDILGIRRFLFWGIPCLLIVLCFFVLDLYLKMPRWSVRLGNMSFSIYLIHYYPVMLLDRMVFDFSTGSAFAVFGVFVTVILCLLCSYVSWYVIERHLTIRLRKLLQ